MTDAIEAPLATGFAEPVDDAHAIFRAVLRAMARPGTVVGLPTALPGATPLPSALAAIALALADFETPVWLDDALRATPDAARYLQFHTGARLADRPDQAAFALIAAAADMPPLATFNQGTLEYPDRSTTLILAVASLEDGTPMTLSGPGIQTSATFAPHPAAGDLAAQLIANRSQFPCGVDLIFASPAAVAAVPRSIIVAP